MNKKVIVSAIIAISILSAWYVSADNHWENHWEREEYKMEKHEMKKEYKEEKHEMKIESVEEMKKHFLEKNGRKEG